MGNFTSDNSLGVVISGQFFYGAIVLAAIVRASLSGGQLPWRQIFEGAVIRKAIILGGNCRGAIILGAIVRGAISQGGIIQGAILLFYSKTFAPPPR